MTAAGQSKPTGTVLRGTLWVAGSRIAVRSMGLLSTLVLARLLTPEDFGLVAVAMGVIALLKSFTEFGVLHALIHYQDVSDEDYSTAWTLNVLRGLILWAVMSGVAYPVSVLLDEPDLLLLLLVVALLPLLESFENPRFVNFEKELDFTALFRMTVLSKALGIAAALAGAVIFQSYWALILGTFVNYAMRVLISFLLIRGRLWPTFRSFRKIFRFSIWLSGAEFLSGLGHQATPIVMGAVMQTHVVGLFHMTKELTVGTFGEIVAPLRRVLFPAFSRLQPGSEAFATLYCQANAGLFMVAAPLTVGLAITASDVVPLLLGSKWLPIVNPMEWLAAGLVFTIFGRTAQSAVMATGQTQMLFTRNLIIMPIRFGMFTAGVVYYGLMGAIYGLILAMVIEALINLDLARRVAGVGVVRQLVSPWRSWIGLLAMAVTTLGAGALMPESGTLANHATRLLLQLAVGASTYVSVQLALWTIAGCPSGPEARLLEALAATVRLRSRRYLPKRP